mmetsp:Transcript_11303/g.31186  ORF Transcript_11303/g.31186 Transcript_11303/m.31186 type:complete len:321 (+) Transcript_11303:99-1061(+)
MDYSLQRLENGSRWLWLLQRLDDAAASKEIFGKVPATSTVVASKASIEAFWKLYVTAISGKTYICCGISGSGKTTAAFYLLHGDTSQRPERAIMIRESDSTNVPLTFCQKHFGAPDAAPVLHSLLIQALIPPDQRRLVKPRNLKETIELAKAFLAKSCSAHSFETNLVQIRNAEEMGSSKVRPNCSKLPLLVIDGLAPTEANRNFVSSLYEVAVDALVTIFVIVKDDEFANELCRINGGRHVLPADPLINNPRGENVGQLFTEVPQWNRMAWRLVDLQNFANWASIGNVALAEGMTPGEVLDLQAQADMNDEKPFRIENA